MRLKEKLILVLIVTILFMNIIVGDNYIMVSAEDSAEWKQETYDYILDIAKRVDFNKRWYRIMDENRKY
ncbi:MAG: hypothetical protein HFJ50_04915 [Clostridia bacterium]|jgi:hypothetical protein|nr:hypothetical protein [Clostridia bacterium]